MLKIIAILAAMGATDVPRQEIDCIATAIWHEARGEAVEGQMAVAHVVMNRVRSDKYPDTACEVVYQPYQFSHIRSAKPDRQSKAWSYAVQDAAFAYAGYTDDPTGGATHYYAHDIVLPAWASVKQTTRVIGGHTFKVAASGGVQ